VPNAAGFGKSIHILVACLTGFALSSVMSKLQVFLKFWLPVLLWMAVMFTASADSHSYEHSFSIVGPLLRWLFPNMPPDRIDLIHHILRKCAHLTEYAILALLLWRALHVSKNKLPVWSWPKVGGTLLLVFLFAASDEFHQSFVPTRTPLFSDVLIDTSGGAIGLLVFWFVRHFRKRPQKEAP
jgi:VanZ family protein